MKTYINLLPRDYRRRAMLRIRVCQWLAIGCIVAIGSITYGWSGYREHLAAQEELDRVEWAYQPTLALIDELTVMRARAATLAEQEKTAEVLEDPRPTLSLLGVVGDAAEKCGGRLQVREFQLGRASESGFGSDLNRSRASHVLMIRGAALDMPVVNQFVLALRASGIFTQADITGDIETTTTDDQQLFIYHVECAIL
jgi:hypothetical protein